MYIKRGIRVCQSIEKVIGVYILFLTIRIITMYIEKSGLDMNFGIVNQIILEITK